MSGNTSATGGYLQQSHTNVKGTSPLTNLLHNAIVGITGLDPTLVRPRWQEQPPTQPPVTTDWCALGVTSYDLVDYPQIIHNSDGLGSDSLFRTVIIILLTSFYGPNSSAIASSLRDGLYINQNYMALAVSGVKFQHAENIVNMTELINTQYVNRVDLFLRFAYMVERTYPVESLVGAEVDVFADNSDNFTVIISQES